MGNAKNSMRKHDPFIFSIEQRVQVHRSHFGAETCKVIELFRTYAFHISSSRYTMFWMAASSTAYLWLLEFIFRPSNQLRHFLTNIFFIQMNPS